MTMMMIESMKMMVMMMIERMKLMVMINDDDDVDDDTER